MVSLQRQSQLDDLVRSEWIGRIVKIVYAKNKSLVGLRGIIVDETKFLFHIDVDGCLKKVFKKGNVFETFFDDISFIVDGSLLVANPVERIKVR